MAVTLELRIYRYLSIILLGLLTSIAGFVALAAVNASGELPAIKQQLEVLNVNLRALSELPLKVQRTEIKLENVENRVTYLESRRGMNVDSN